MPSKIGNRLRELRGAKSIEEFAKLLRTNKNTLGGYERGERLPNVDFLARFADVSKADLLDLIRVRLESSDVEGGHLAAAIDALAAATRERNAGPRMSDRAIGEIPISEAPHHLLFPGDATPVIVSEEARTRVTDLGYTLLPRYEMQASAGTGAVVQSEQIVDHLAFRTEFLRNRLGRNPANLILIEARGDSMEPTIRDGDLLLVDTSEPHIRDNAIYVLRIDDALVVKRVQRSFKGGIVVLSDNPRYPPEKLAEVDAPAVIGQVIWHAGVL